MNVYIDAFCECFPFAVPATEAERKYITTTKRSISEKARSPFFFIRKKYFFSSSWCLLPSSFCIFFLILCHILVLFMFFIESFFTASFFLHLLLSVTFNFVFNYNFSLDVFLCCFFRVFFSSPPLFFSSFWNMQHETVGPQNVYINSKREFHYFISESWSESERTFFATAGKFFLLFFQLWGWNQLLRLVEKKNQRTRLIQNRLVWHDTQKINENRGKC